MLSLLLAVSALARASMTASEPLSTVPIALDLFKLSRALDLYLVSASLKSYLNLNFACFQITLFKASPLALMPADENLITGV
jgi:hypothetical protein